MLFALPLRFGLLVAALGFLISCQAAVVSPTPEPEPEPPPQPTLQGTWLFENTYDHDDHGHVTYTQVLTFTASGRAITINEEVSTTTREVVEEWHDANGWEATDTTVTRTWFDDHDDHDETPQIRRTLEKTYYWVEGRNVLFLEPWNDDQRSYDSLDRYTRIVDPTPGGLVGTWTYEAVWDRTEDHGHTVDQHWTFTFGEDGAFTEVYRHAPDTDEVPPHTFTVSGTWSHGENDPYFIMVSVDNTMVHVLDRDDPEELIRYRGATLRYAYVPTKAPDVIAVSTRISEVMYDGELGIWVDNMDHRYGDYWMRLSR